MLFCTIINDSFAFNKSATQKTKASEIRKFLFTDPLKINFDNANKYLQEPISKKEVGEKTMLMSKFILAEDSTIAYFVSLDDKKRFSYQMLFDVESCSELPSLIKKAYGKDFVYYLDGEEGNGNVIVLQGSMDVKNWRIALECIDKNDGTSQNDEPSPIDRPLVTMVSGSKNNIQKIFKRQFIECAFTSGGDVVFQIDESNKLLRGQNGLTLKTTRFDDDFIVVTNIDNSKRVEIDRKTGKIVMSNSFFGTCKKRDSEKKF